MKPLLLALVLLASLQDVWSDCPAPASEFRLPGDYLLGGLFDIHLAEPSVARDRPVSLVCSRHQFSGSGHRRFQVMRFAVEEINNSTDILPGVSLGYDIFDHCSDTFNFPNVLKLISVDGSLQLQGKANKPAPRVIAVTGPYGSTQTLTMAQLFMTNLTPMVNYGASASSLSEKQRFPSFLRTIPSNKVIIQLLVDIIHHFDWHWVAFLYSSDIYSRDGMDMFKSTIKGTGVCLAYRNEVTSHSDFRQIFRDINKQRISVVIIFTYHDEAVVRSASRLNVSEKVWILSGLSSLNKGLIEDKEIRKIGTVLAVIVVSVPLPGFLQFIYSSTEKKECANVGQQKFCNQVCNCSSVDSGSIVAENPGYSFPVYSAVYAVAHALHNVLRCGAHGCHDNITVYPYMVLEELKKSNFSLLNHTVQFDKHGDPVFTSYSIVFWNNTGHAEEVGSYETKKPVPLFINDTRIEWFTNGTVPVSVCSKECRAGYKRIQDDLRECCFLCEICPNGTYLNKTGDPYRCSECDDDTEWSEAGSTSCNQRTVEFVSLTEASSVLLLSAICVMVVLSLTLAVLFAFNYNTPVVRSAGGPMCFLILGCLTLCGLSVTTFFGKPTRLRCVLRNVPFMLFYTCCLACLVVRAFQIVCVFKMASKFPRLHAWWMKYNGQWVTIVVAFVAQALLLTAKNLDETPHPHSDAESYHDRIILTCKNSTYKLFSVSMVIPITLCCLCFAFSYMGKDLPKNYNEAKAITFCLLLLILTWTGLTVVYTLYRGKHIQTLNALAVLSCVYFILLWYFLPKCYIIVFQPHKNTQKYFQGLIQSYTKNISK